ncbi:MAG: transposase [Rhodospirillales bacterium]|nr:transposase [Rhodospirillales bacterium]
MTKACRYLSEAQKRAAVAHVAGGEAVSTVARSIGINRNWLYEWCSRT